MDDNAKKEKIAAAKRKLKQFQQKSTRSTNSTAGPTTTAASKTKQAKPAANSGLRGSPKRNTSEPMEIQIPPQQTRHSGYSNDSSPNEDPVSNSESESTTKNTAEAVSMSPQLYNVNSGDNELTLDAVLDHREPLGAIRTTASTESLQQLSRQLNGLLQESQSYVNGEVGISGSGLMELEQRNRELASLLEKHNQANAQLNTQVEHLRVHDQALQEQLLKERSNFEERLRKDLGLLKEQLQVHIQTIGILVAEKTELQSQLNQTRKTSEQRFEEVEEMTGRLKASRQRVADLERNLSSTSSSTQQFEKSSKDLTKEVDRLKLELFKVTKSQDEFQQLTSELQEKLSTKVYECNERDQWLSELKSKLEMAEIYVHQLSSQSENKDQESLQLVENLRLERDELKLRMHQVEDALQKSSREQDQMSSQYKEYIDRIQHQGQQLTDQVKTLTEEREQLLNKQYEQERSLQQLNTQLEDAKMEPAVSLKQNDGIKEALENEIERFKLEYEELAHKHETQILDNSQLSRFLEEKESRISELDMTVSRLNEEASDKEHILEAVQSDKTALSRAIAQNKELKRQLAELQNGFVTMSNDSMEMMTKLQSEQHSSKELAARLAQQEDELKEIREALFMKESQLNELNKMSNETQKSHYHHEQLSDRLRHYEAQATLVETLQRELQSAQAMVDALTSQNSELRTMLIRSTESKAQSEDMVNGEVADKRGEVIDSLSAAIRQLEAERNQLMDQLKDQRNLSDSLTVTVSDFEQEVIRLKASNTDTEKISRYDYDSLKKAMTLIEDRYTKAMRDKADLTDKAEQLEHLVTQLQGETDTIGEYISLYHHQRALLQQREKQKNDYIQHLAQDREDLQTKLGQLQTLIMQLLGERNMLHSYHEESLRIQDSNLQNHSNQENDHHSNHHHHNHHHHHHGHHHQNGEKPPDPLIQPHIASASLQEDPELMMVNGAHDISNDWPDYTSSSASSDSGSDVEAIVASSRNLSNEDYDQINENSASIIQSQDPSLSPTLTPNPDARSRTSITGSEHNESGSSKSSLPKDELTAKKILNLLNELGHSNIVETIPFPERYFHPCKYCTGRLQVL